MSAIMVENLTKKFGGFRALDNLSFEVAEGSITGFLGPNGAGKSTTMNVLMGFIAPSEGSATVLGEAVSPHMRVRRDIGFLSSNMALDGSLTAEQEIRYYAGLSRVAPDYGLQLADELKLDLRAKVRNLSTGNHQKVALIVALLARPKLLILDEPTNGLDPLVQAQFNKIIKELHAAGTTIFISSHILSEVSELCEDFIFIKQGRIAAKMTKDELLSKSGESIRLKSTPEILKLLKKHKIRYQVEAADLGKTFMGYYQEDKDV